MSDIELYRQKPRKLSEKQVREIGNMYAGGATMGSLMERFGISWYVLTKALVWGGFKTHIQTSTDLTEAQDPEVIKLYRTGLPICAVAKQLKASPWYISKALKRNGIYIRGEAPDPKIAEIVAHDYANGLSFEKIREKHGYGFGYVKKMLKMSGVESRPDQWHTVNREYFKVIDSHEKAYFVGLIMAVGCVLWNRPKTQINKLVLSLEEKDSYLIDQFVKAVQYSGTVTRREDSRRDEYIRQPQRKVGIYDMEFVSALTRYGISPNKSMTHPFFTNIPKEFIVSALLGYFDGDGTVSYHANDSHRLSAGMIGSVPFIDAVVKLLHEQGLKCSSRIKKTKAGIDMKEVRMKGNRSCLAFYRYLYQAGIPCLERKKAKFEWVMEQQRLGLIKQT